VKVYFDVDGASKRSSGVVGGGVGGGGSGGSRDALESYPSVDYHNKRDSTIEYARVVMIPLSHNVGQDVRLEIFFDAKWMLISEVQFESSKFVKLLKLL